MSGDTLTGADVLANHYALTLGCGTCRVLRGVDLGGWPAAALNRPLKALFLERRFRCDRCGSLSDGLQVKQAPGINSTAGPILDLTAP